MERVIGNYTSQENRSFPLDCETLEAIQNNIDMLGALGNMGGDKTILSGCEVKDGGGRQEGYIFLKTLAYPLGEVLHFPGSNEDSDYLHLVTENGDVTQGEVDYIGAYTTRQVANGEGNEQWAWAELKSPVDIAAIAELLRSEMAEITEEVARIKPVPLGVVEMYSGSTIPENYAVCDGQALSQELYADLYRVLGTRYNKPDTAEGMFCLPDLRGRFIVGQGGDSDYNSIGNTGGEKTHQLTAAESGSPAHTHAGSSDWQGQHAHNIYGYGSWEDDGNAGKMVEVSGRKTTDGDIQYNDENNPYWLYTTSAGGHNHAITIDNNQPQNASQSHENRPPYFVLFYIMRLK